MNENIKKKGRVVRAQEAVNGSGDELPHGEHLETPLHRGCLVSAPGSAEGIFIYYLLLVLASIVSILEADCLTSFHT